MDQAAAEAVTQAFILFYPRLRNRCMRPNCPVTVAVMTLLTLDACAIQAQDEGARLEDVRHSL